MYFLIENKIEKYDVLFKRIEEITIASEQEWDNLKEVERRLSDIVLLIKNAIQSFFMKLTEKTGTSSGTWSVFYRQKSSWKGKGRQSADKRKYKFVN